MVSLNTTNLQLDIKAISDLINSDENYVVMSETEYNELKKERSNSENADMLTDEFESENTETVSDVGLKLRELENKYKGGKIPLFELCGIWKGKVFMSDDFDEPLEEMREYM